MPVARHYPSVSRVSEEAKAIIEALGGSVTKVHYNRLGIRALLKPHKFPRGLPKPARTPPRLRGKVDREGTLPAPGPSYEETMRVVAEKKAAEEKAAVRA